MELVDVPDSKSGVGNYVPVRPRPSANIKRHLIGVFFLGIKKGGEPAQVVRAQVS